MRLNDKTLLEIVNSIPLVSIDLVMRNTAGEVLLGKRVNRPAKGNWFVPGGRIRKNELILDSINRISEAELGISLTSGPPRFLGVFEHIYDDNFLGEAGVNTHYVVLAYECQIEDDARLELDSQHSETKWWSVNELLNNPDVHKYVKAYFRET